MGFVDRNKSLGRDWICRPTLSHSVRLVVYGGKYLKVAAEWFGILLNGMRSTGGWS